MKKQYDQDNNLHVHATTSYELLTNQDYGNAEREIALAKELGAKSLNFHIPNEIQFASCRNLDKGYDFINLVQEQAKKTNVLVVWENVYQANTDDWSVKESCSLIPDDVFLCLDIGHLALGSIDHKEALERIDKFLIQYSKRIKHLHLHTNDLVHDLHDNDLPKLMSFLGQDRFEKLIFERSYILEGSE